MTIQESLHKLKEGNTRFVTDQLNRNLKDSAKRESLVSGQEPFAIILSCADSRVVPEFAFDTGLGELFVIRVAGNIANCSSIASIEYAVTYLGSKLIVVLGHQSCGAVAAAIKGGDTSTNIKHLLSHIEPAVSACNNDANMNDVVKKNAELTATNLIKKSTILKEAVGNESLKIVPAYYHLDTGKVDFL